MRSARFSLQTLPVDEYPTLPTMPTQTGLVDASVFEKSVSQVVIAAGRDELLNVFTGVRVEINGDQLSLLATDRYRMALKELTWQPSSPDIEGAVLVPGRVLADTAKSLTSGKTVTVSLSTTSPRARAWSGSSARARRVVARPPPACSTRPSRRCGTSWTSSAPSRCASPPPTCSPP